MITPSSLAAGNFVGVENEQFAVSAQVIAQKNLIIGTVDPAKHSALNLNEPMRVFSAEQVGALTGFGYMLHRLARALFAGGISETWIIPQSQVNIAVPFDEAEGTLTLSGTATQPGTIALYIAGELYPLGVGIGTTHIAAADGLAELVNADENSPVIAVSDGAGEITFTSKTAGTWGNGIKLNLNLLSTESLPAGLEAVVVDMAGGSGVPNIQPALDSLGTGDAQNELGFTNLIHGYGADAAVLNALSIYNGIGNDFVGNYRKEVARPFRSLIGNTDPGFEYGLSELLDLANTRRNDRTNGVLGCPGEPYHPQELSARAMGQMAVKNSIRAESSYIDDFLLPSFANNVDRWTDDYANRDQAVRGGVGTTKVQDGNILLQNIITFYRPSDVAPESNGYRSMRNISIIQNLLYNYRMNFERSKWKDIVIVQDAANVTDTQSREKARDIDSVLDDLVALADVFAGKAWLYTADYTKSELQKGDKVALRAGLTGFDIIFPVIFSGEGGIYNTEIKFDTSIAVLAGGE